MPLFDGRDLLPSLPQFIPDFAEFSPSNLTFCIPATKISSSAFLHFIHSGKPSFL